MGGPGRILWYCPVCDGETCVPVLNLRAAMTAIASIGRHEEPDGTELRRTIVHDCPDGRFGIAEVAEGVPTPMEGDTPLSD